MGQYWHPVNLDKKEFIDPHKLGSGLKLWEQLANAPGTGAALVILCAAMPEARGGGDFDLDVNWHGPERVDMRGPGPMPEDYQAVAKRTIGRWAGDRIALVGDYAEDGDLPGELKASAIYGLCQDEEDVVYLKRPSKAKGMRLMHRVADDSTYNGSPHPGAGKYAHVKLVKASVYKDVTDDVCRVIEHELQGKFEGDGWREFKRNKEA